MLADSHIFLIQNLKLQNCTHLNTKTIKIRLKFKRHVVLKMHRRSKHSIPSEINNTFSKLSTPLSKKKHLKLKNSPNVNERTKYKKKCSAHRIFPDREIESKHVIGSGSNQDFIFLWIHRFSVKIFNIHLSIFSDFNQFFHRHNRKLPILSQAVYLVMLPGNSSPWQAVISGESQRRSVAPAHKEPNLEHLRSLDSTLQAASKTVVRLKRIMPCSLLKCHTRRRRWRKLEIEEIYFKIQPHCWAFGHSNHVNCKCNKL